MPSATLSSAASRLGEALLRAAWSQWAAVGMPAAGVRAARGMVDPEALVLASTWLRETEPRLGRLLGLWAGAGARLLSTQRMRNLARDLPADLAAGLAGFAHLALTRGKDARWRALARAPAEYAGEEWKREPEAMASSEAPAALMLRLRLGLGVGIKADVLAFLAGRAGSAETVQATARAVSYDPRAVRRAVEELAAAGFIQSRATAPAAWYVPSERWEWAWGGGDPPRWCFWHQIYALGAALDRSIGQSVVEPSAYLQSSLARDIIGRHRLAFDLNGIPLTSPAGHPGEAFLDAFQGDVERLADRVERNFI